MGEPDQNKSAVGRGGRSRTTSTETETPQGRKTLRGGNFGSKQKTSQADPTITDPNGQSINEDDLKNMPADSINIVVDGIPLTGDVMDQLSETDITSAQDALDVYNKIKELIQADKLNMGSETETAPQTPPTGRGGRGRGQAAATPAHQEQEISIEIFNGAEEIASIEGKVMPDIPEIMKTLESTPAIEVPASNKGFNH